MGRVHAVTGGRYSVVLDDGWEVEATLRGRLKKDRRGTDRAVIGDRVRVLEQTSGWTIEEVEERSSAFVRRGAGGRRPKVVAANVDRVFAVVAAREPDPSLELIDRLLAVIESCRLHAALVVNKVDLPGAAEPAAELAELYAPLGYTVLRTSARTGEGVAALAQAMASGTSALVGPSGGGKSSLLNAVDPSLELRTGALSRKTGTGRHTTVSSRLIRLASGGLVADTPGFGDIGLWGIEPDAVEACFPEMVALAEGCRFAGCAHDREPDCAVRSAVEAGRLPPSRYRSYLRLREEAVAATRP